MNKQSNKAYLQELQNEYAMEKSPSLCGPHGLQVQFPLALATKQL